MYFLEKYSKRIYDADFTVGSWPYFGSFRELGRGMLSACFAWIILVEGFCWRLGHEVWLDQPFLLTSHSVTLVVAKHQANELDGNSNSREIWVYPKDLANVFRACLGSILVQLGEAATKKKIKHLKDTVEARHWYRPLSRKKSAAST